MGVQYKTRRVILNFLRVDLSRQSAEKLLLDLKGEPFGLDAFLQCAEENRVVPLLFWRLRQLGIASSHFPQLFQRLEAGYYQNLARNFLLKRELVGVLGAFFQEGLHVIVWKGAVFLFGTPPMESVRIMDDVDIIVREGEDEKAIEILGDLGYKKGGEGDFHFTKPDSAGFIDLQIFQPRSYRFYYPDWESFWNSCTVVQDKVPVRFPNPTDHFYQLFVHNTYHHHNFINQSLADLYDLANLIPKFRDGDEINWNRIEELARNLHLENFLCIFLYLAERRLGTPPILKTNNLAIENRIKRYLPWFEGGVSVPGWLYYALSRLLLINLGGRGFLNYFVNSYRILIKRSVLESEHSVMRSAYRIKEVEPHLVFFKIVHAFRVLLLHFLALSYFLYSRLLRLPALKKSGRLR